MSETLSRDLLDLTAGELAKAVGERKVSALELAEQAIARIEARDGPLNAVVVRDFDRARDAAKAVDAAVARGERGPLMGVPMTVKESHDVAGLPSTWGFEPFKDYVAPSDGVVVARLKAAGAVILGKTNVPVMLSDFQSVNPIYGRTNNPWDPTRTPGGSSGGSAAALAAGMVPLEFGSDIGGSIRVPAAFCGVFGHKPSFGLVPSRGHSPAGMTGAPPPLAVVGPLARSAADLRLALDVTAGPDTPDSIGYRLDLPDARHGRLGDYRVLIVDALPGVALDSEIKAALHGLADKLEKLGATVARQSDLLPDPAKAREVFMGLLNTAMSRRQPGANPIDAHQFMDLQDGQMAIRRQWGELFRSFDVVLAPTIGVTAFPHVTEPDPAKRRLTVDGQETGYFDQLAWPGIPLVANLPATATPMGFSKAGLPMSVQVIGPYLEDRTTLAFSGLLEREFGGFRAPPPL
jgi:amidase